MTGGSRPLTLALELLENAGPPPKIRLFRRLLRLPRRLEPETPSKALRRAASAVFGHPNRTGATRQSDGSVTFTLEWRFDPSRLREAQRILNQNPVPDVDGRPAATIRADRLPPSNAPLDTVRLADRNL